MPTYAWKAGARYSVAAQVIGDELDRLRRPTGDLHPEDVVEAARHPDSPLHRCGFPADDLEAAEIARRAWARRVIQQVVVVTVRRTGPPVTHVANVHVPADPDGDGRGYYAAARVLNDEELRTRAMAEALAQLEAFKKRWATLKELAAVFAAIEAAAKKLEAQQRPTQRKKPRPKKAS